MSTYVQKLNVVEAELWDGEDRADLLINKGTDIKRVPRGAKKPDVEIPSGCGLLEGTFHVVESDSYIVTSPGGRFPMKRKLFEKMYMPAKDALAALKK